MIFDDFCSSSQREQRALNCKEITFFRARSDQNNQVQTPVKFQFVKPVAFSDKSCQMMADYAVADLFAHRYSHAVCISALSSEHIQNQCPVCDGSSPLIDDGKISGLF